MTITVTVTDMSCDGCEDIVEGAVADVPGVESVEADRTAESVTVEGDDADVNAIVRAIDFAGYNPVEDSVTEGDAEPAAEESQSDESEEDTEDEDSAADDNDEAGSDEDAADDADEQSGDEDDE